MKTSSVYTGSEILQRITKSKPIIITIDALFSLPKNGLPRKAAKEMIRRGYRVFSLNLPAMRKLALRAIRLNKLIAEKRYKTLEAHPTLTRRALDMS